MSVLWYLCPYDISSASGRVTRRCAMSRHIPSVPNADGAIWEEAEILGNHAAVKVSAPDAVHLTIQADVDFLLLPLDGTTPVPVRAVLRSKLNALGYTDVELDATGWTRRELLRAITSVRQDILGPNATRDGVLFGGRIPAGKSSNDIDRRLAG